MVLPFIIFIHQQHTLVFPVQRHSSIHRVIAGSCLNQGSLSTFFAFFFNFYKTTTSGACLDNVDAVRLVFL
uniref:Uncharacterized protein n=1 Tax=uncultured gamma proteobacterium HF0010_16J05 TaxID=710981 RepID=E0XR43_9GAMM|nr:hypothetical protein [uncultured gamma proteobacterium HF0010_16J05]